MNCLQSERQQSEATYLIHDDGLMKLEIGGVLRMLEDFCKFGPSKEGEQ